MNITFQKTEVQDFWNRQHREVKYLILENLILCGALQGIADIDQATQAEFFELPFNIRDSITDYYEAKYK